MASVIVAGGGLAGMAATAALASAGYEVDLFESRPFLGGRATSYPIPIRRRRRRDYRQLPAHFASMLRQFTRFLLSARCSGSDRISQRILFHRTRRTDIGFSSRRASETSSISLESFRSDAVFVRGRENCADQGLLALQQEYKQRTDLQRHHDGAVAAGEEAAAARHRPFLAADSGQRDQRGTRPHGRCPRFSGFLARISCDQHAYEMGVPITPDVWAIYISCRFVAAISESFGCILRTAVENNYPRGRLSERTELLQRIIYIRSVLSNEPKSLDASAPDFEHSPITGIHIWFDQPVTDLPHATLLDRTLQWMFNKESGDYLQLVVSASRSLVRMDRNEILADSRFASLREFFPKAATARVERFHVVKEVQSDFFRDARDCRGLDPHRAIQTCFRAGDWADSGWPATMEGAVRSGYIAAEAVTRQPDLRVRFVTTRLA